MKCVALAFFGIALAAHCAAAQQKQKVSIHALPENTKYTQQHLIDVDDSPGHQVLIFELHRTWTTDAPVINGVKVKEQWARSFSDYVDGNGPATVYQTYVMENGDKIFQRSTLVSQSSGDGKLSTSNVGVVTGGTGKFLGIRGGSRTTTLSEPKAGKNDSKSELEYWLDK